MINSFIESLERLRPEIQKKIVIRTSKIGRRVERNQLNYVLKSNRVRKQTFKLFSGKKNYSQILTEFVLLMARLEFKYLGLKNRH